MRAVASFWLVGATMLVKPVVMTKPPALPAIAQNVLPGEGWAAGTYRLHGPARIFDSWKRQRRQIAILKAGARFTLLSGLCEVSRPDLIVVTAAIPELQLEPGEQILRFTYLGEGNADFWAKGRWYAAGDLGFVRNADGSGCQGLCKAKEVEAGRNEWWFRVRLSDGRVGWTDAADSVNPNVR